MAERSPGHWGASLADHACGMDPPSHHKAPRIEPAGPLLGTIWRCMNLPVWPIPSQPGLVVGGVLILVVIIVIIVVLFVVIAGPDD